MKALLTGMHGTVAPVLARALSQAGHAVVAWDRAIHPVDPPDAVRFFLRCEQPDLVCHLALGSPEWAECLARTCAADGVAFLYVSTVSVYGGTQTGPFTVADEPQPDSDYGRYKLECEHRVRRVNPAACLVRLGWQIGAAPGGNQMVDYLDRAFREHGRIDASTRWFPACSFLEDTAASLANLIQTSPRGLYHLDGNPGLNFHEIACGLNQLLGHPWHVAPVAGLAQNHRMLDPRLPVPSVAGRFPV